jgi:hypothetical protein
MLYNLGAKVNLIRNNVVCKRVATISE